jgi:hypothetical protein
LAIYRIPAYLYPSVALSLKVTEFNLCKPQSQRWILRPFPPFTMGKARKAEKFNPAGLRNLTLYHLQ